MFLYAKTIDTVVTQITIQQSFFPVSATLYLSLWVYFIVTLFLSRNIFWDFQLFVFLIYCENYVVKNCNNITELIVLPTKENMERLWFISYPLLSSASTSSTLMPKMKRFSSPASSAISTLAPSMVPMVRAPFNINFMLPVPEASVPAVEICSDRSAAGMAGSWWKSTKKCFVFVFYGTSLDFRK